MRTRFVFIALAVFIALPVARRARGQAAAPVAAHVELDATSKAELLKARDRIWRAWFANDSVELARLLPPAVTAVEGADGYEDRAAILVGSRMFAAGGGKLVRIQFVDTEIVSYGNLAIVHARYELETESAGRRNKRGGRATEIFVRRNGAWLNPFWHLDS